MPFTRFAAVIALAMFWTLPGAAQGQSAPAGDAGAAPSKEFRETQEIIRRLQNRIAIINDASADRARDIELFNAKINEVLDLLAEQRTRNDDLKSEISVIDDLLGLERANLKAERGNLGAERDKAASLHIELAELAEKLKRSEDGQRISKSRLAITQENLATTAARLDQQIIIAGVRLRRIDELNGVVAELKSLLREMQNRPRRRPTTLNSRNR